METAKQQQINNFMRYPLYGFASNEMETEQQKQINNAIKFLALQIAYATEAGRQQIADDLISLANGKIPAHVAVRIADWK